MTQVLLALLGIARTLGGVILGSRLEHRRWLRDKRLVAYADYSAAINRWLQSFTHRDIADLNPLTADVRQLVDTQQYVRLTAPAETRDAAQTVLRIALEAFVRFGEVADERDLSDEEEAAVMTDLSVAGQRLFALQEADVQRRRPRRA